MSPRAAREAPLLRFFLCMSPGAQSGQKGRWLDHQSGGYQQGSEMLGCVASRKDRQAPGSSTSSDVSSGHTAAVTSSPQGQTHAVSGQGPGSSGGDPSGTTRAWRLLRPVTRPHAAVCRVSPAGRDTRSRGPRPKQPEPGASSGEGPYLPGHSSRTELLAIVVGGQPIASLLFQCSGGSTRLPPLAVNAQCDKEAASLRIE
ncbi:hypothetical protein NDU88_004613 [Pleurodeles waltl]|uniref:Uncharacterized protein n=1 Tax=Pleurodeles waltl TaxID=8319 RepID=A0AAV7LLX6_PLEWA|nr:hypothetical protein NDU88_004613 [Pleurodeles waltl]